MVSVRSELIKERNAKQKTMFHSSESSEMGCFVRLLRTRASVSTHAAGWKELRLGCQKFPGMLAEKRPLEPGHPGSCMWLERPVDSEEPINTFFPFVLVPSLGNFLVVFKTVYYYRCDDPTNAIHWLFTTCPSFNKHLWSHSLCQALY